MNWEYDSALKTADRHAFFKYMVKSIAEKHGLRATFMPKPFSHLTGNGCHAHLSLWSSKTGKNLFADPQGELGLSTLAYNFLGGIMHAADALAAITNPTVNSYKRLNAPPTLVRRDLVTEHNHICRQQPDPHDPHSRRGRFELRLADGAANPYLLQAALLVAGLDGIKNKRDPGKRLDIDMYAEGHKVKNARRLPLNLLDALRAFDQIAVLREGLGDEFSSAYLKLKVRGLEQILTPPHRMGARDDARLLRARTILRMRLSGSRAPDRQANYLRRRFALWS